MPGEKDGSLDPYDSSHDKHGSDTRFGKQRCPGDHCQV